MFESVQDGGLLRAGSRLRVSGKKVAALAWWWAAVMFGLAILVSAGVPVLAQDSLDGEILKLPEFFGVPQGDNLIQGKILYDNGARTIFRAREGSMVTVEWDGYFDGFVPLRGDDGSVVLSLYRIELVEKRGGGTGEIAHSFGAAVSGVDEVTSLEGMPFDVEITKVGKHSFSTPCFKGEGELPPPEVLRQLSAGSCCARDCTGAVVCACAVFSACGSCCTKECCGNPEGPVQPSTNLVGQP